jgi:hypothetical protein
MANLSAILQQAKQMYAPITQATTDAINNSYAQQAAADKSVYNNAYTQGQQTLSQVPSQFNGQRNSADITKNQALNMVPTYLANSGAATDSGANYLARQSVGNAFQNTMSGIGKDQNAAVQNAQNNLNTLAANEVANQAKLNASKSTDLANAYTSTAGNILSQAYNQYNSDLNREEQAAEAAAALQKKQQDTLTPEQIADAAMKAEGSKTGTGTKATTNVILAYNNITNALDANGVTDPTIRNRAYARAGITQDLYNNTMSKSIANVYNTISKIGAGYTSGGQYTQKGKDLMKQALINRYNDGSLTDAAFAEIMQHYGL